MITIEDLKESLRRHLGALIDVYEAGIAAVAPVPGPGDVPEDRAATPSAPSGPGLHEGALGCADAARAEAIESCLKEFHTAILAAEAAESARLRAQEIAGVLLDRASSARRIADVIQIDAQEVQRQLGARASLGELDLRRLAEARAAARVGEMVCQRAEAEALVARQRNERVAAAALSALLAAARADPGRGNRGLDPIYARVARTAAEHAAAEAGQLGARPCDATRGPEQPRETPGARRQET